MHFDWNLKRLLLPGGGVDLPALTQDLMSFPFHLAMTVREDDGEWLMPMTNGKKLRQYGFRVVGREAVTLGGDTPIETLHLQGTRAGEGTLDVWLAPVRHWLPVRIRTQDQMGKTMVLTLDSIE